MKLRKVKFVAMMMVAIIILPGLAIAQNLEVEGQAKIMVMPSDDTADQIVVQQTDGTLAVRSAATLAQTQGPGDYGTVVNPVTGKVWLDRNLGATQVATSSTDTASYGDLYQWGRNADGHQIRTSGTRNIQASLFFTNTGLFIIGDISWLSNNEAHMWSGSAAENNPCPSGFRVPTAGEWEQERLTWSSNNAAGAFASPLKLPMAGSRGFSSGSLFVVGTRGSYYSSTLAGSGSFHLVFESSNALILVSSRATGCSVRCIKD